MNYLWNLKLRNTISYKILDFIISVFALILISLIIFIVLTELVMIGAFSFSTAFFIYCTISVFLITVIMID